MDKRCVWFGHGKIVHDNLASVCERCSLHSFWDDPDNPEAYPTGENFHDHSRIYRPLWMLRATYNDIVANLKDRLWRWRNPDLPF